jgi:RsiW-degrading membrane proteinase PrsW (M82 family)
VNGPYGQGPYEGAPYRESPANPNMPSPYRTRRIIGGSLWLLGQGVGGLLFLLLFIILPLFEENPANAFLAMALGAAIAFPAMVVYLTFPRLLDRYDPEPLWALLLCLFWGALAACGFAGFINTAIGAVFSGIAGQDVGEAISVVISAPVCEEFFKGIMVVGVFYFLRDQFDGVVDGIIYATFTAIGFAATENVIYYANAMQEGGVDALGITVLLRGFLAPWGHPLYTSMTGIGLGLARESENKYVRVLAPFIGYGAAVFLHATWNGTALVGGGVAFLCMLPLWLLFVAAFVVLVLVLVRRRGNIIRQHLLDEVALKNISQAELDLVCSAFGGLTAFFKRGRKGSDFVRAIARLGLSKWHTGRAMRGKNQTVSMDFILPLRARIKDLRSQGASPV